jgi:hypothetical protein
MKFHELQMRYRDAARSAVEELRAMKPDETLYAFALYTDDDCCATSAAANTEEALQRKLDKEALRLKQAGESLQKYGGLDYYRWATGEWDYEGIGHNGFPSYEEMEAMQEGKSSKAFKRGVLDAMVGALKELDSAGVFGTGPQREGITLFVTITDCDEAVHIEDRSARRLNPRQIARRFHHRYSWKLRMFARLGALVSRFRR